MSYARKWGSAQKKKNKSMLVCQRDPGAKLKAPMTKDGKIWAIKSKCSIGL